MINIAEAHTGETGEGAGVDDGHHNMMTGYGHSQFGMGWMWLYQILFLTLIVLGIILIVKTLLKK